MRNEHGWRTRTEDGRKREVRARLFGRVWTLESKAEDENDWTVLEEPPLADLVALRGVLFDKYRRNRVPREHVDGVEKLILARGGSWEE